MDGSLKLEIGKFEIELPVEVIYEHQPGYNGGIVSPSYREHCAVTSIAVRLDDKKVRTRDHSRALAAVRHRLAEALWEVIHADPRTLEMLEDECLEDYRASAEDRRFASTGI